MVRARRSWLQRKQRPAGGSGRIKRRLSVELLEDRTLPSFVTASTFPVAPNPSLGSNPEAIVTGDFNHNGNLDVATANQDSNTVSVLLGNGNGTFKPATVIRVGKSPEAISFLHGCCPGCLRQHGDGLPGHSPV
jgi:hypothetical protein